jgi:hypothetical protein
MRYLGKAYIEKEDNYSYWNPPMTQNYESAGQVGFGAPNLDNLAAAAKMSGVQLDDHSGNNSIFIGTTAGNNYIMTSAAGTLDPPSFISLDPFPYSMGGMIGVLRNSLGGVSNNKILLISGSQITPQALILSADGLFTKLTTIIDPTGASEGLQNAQWDSQRNRWWCISTITFPNDGFIITMKETGVVTNSLQSPIVNSGKTVQVENTLQFTRDGGIFFMSQTTSPYSDWNIFEFDYDTFTFGESWNVLNTTIGTIPIISNFRSKTLYQIYIPRTNKILIFGEAQQEIGGEIFTFKLVFDPVTKTTYWDGKKYFSRNFAFFGGIFKAAFDEQTNTVFLGVQTPTTEVETYTIDTSQDKCPFFTNAIPLVSAIDSFKCYFVDDLYRKIYLYTG